MLRFLTRLTEKEKTILTAIYQAIIPKGGPFALGAEDVPLVPLSERMIRLMIPSMQFKVKIALWLVEWVAIFYGVEHRRFTQQTLPSRFRVLASLEASRFFAFREIFLMFKTIGSFAFYDDNRVLEALGSKWRFI